MSIKTLIKNMINVNEAAHKAKEKVRVQIGICEGEENENCISSDEDVICYSEQL
mgnify:CR=1 FL=1